MNKDWQDKLASYGASVDAQGRVSFAGETGTAGVLQANDPADDSALLVDLSHLAVVDITGSDAQSFFQDQVCNDLTELSDRDFQLNGYCTPKGRLLALFTVFNHEDGFRLLLPENVVQAFTKRLQMFVMRAQVNINVRDDLICSGLVFRDADVGNAIQLPADAPALPMTELQLVKNQQMHILRWPDMPGTNAPEAGNPSLQQRYICIAEADLMSTLWETKGFEFRSGRYWRWGDINAGIPSVYASSTEQFIPQMLNMQFISALSFKKGCYPGQEIVARMQYLGKLKKHMRHLRIPDANDATEPGTVLSTDTNNNAGQVVDAVLDAAGLNLLAVVGIDMQANELKLGEHRLVEATLPYSITPEDSEAS